MLAKQSNTHKTGLSPKYSHVNSMAIHDVLRDHGFSETGYRQNKVYAPEREGFQRHMSIFSRGEMTDNGGNFNVLLLNAHDGTSAIRLELGYFRIVCENQLINSQLGFRVAHRGSVLERLNQQIPQLIGDYEIFRGQKEKLTGITLDHDQKTAILTAALALRGLDGSGIDDEDLRKKILTYNLQSMDHCKRYGDRGSDAWTVLNRVQENVIRGTNHDFMSATDKNIHFRKLRAVNSMDRVVRYNQEIMKTVIDVAGVA